MPPDVRIELALCSDLPKLMEVERAANQLFLAHGVTGVSADDVTPLAQLDEGREAGLLWVAREGRGEPIGFALVCLVDAQPHLEELDVHPAFGRRGVGRTLLGTVLAWARAAGHRCVTLTTFRGFRWNEPFYASAGFRTLAPDELGPGLAAVVADETARGLDPAARVAMRCELAAGAEPR